MEFALVLWNMVIYFSPCGTRSGIVEFRVIFSACRTRFGIVEFCVIFLHILKVLVERIQLLFVHVCCIFCIVFFVLYFLCCIKINSLSTTDFSDICLEDF